MVRGWLCVAEVTTSCTLHMCIYLFCARVFFSKAPLSFFVSLRIFTYFFFYIAHGWLCLHRLCSGSLGYGLQ